MTSEAGPMNYDVTEAASLRSPQPPMDALEVSRVVLRVVELPLVTRFETSMGALTIREAVIVEVHADGCVGWGEAAAWQHPWFSYETTATTRYVLRDYLIPALLSGPARVSGDEIDPAIRGYPMAKAAVESALLDAMAKRDGISLATALGGTAATVPVGISLGIEPTLDDLLGLIQGAVSDQYRRVKLKVKPGWDVAVVREVREAFGDRLSLAVDANAAYSWADVPTLRELDALGLSMIEQPFDHSDFDLHARLQSQLGTPVCLDETIKTAQDAAIAIKLGSCQVINIKPGRVGGLLNARAIHDLCAAHGLPVFCGGMLETGIGRAANLALASLPGFTIPSDLSASRRYFSRDVIISPFELGDGGVLAVPAGPGTGIAVDERALDACTLEREVFE
jgi:o-succinylbenzoate synthase